MSERPAAANSMKITLKAGTALLASLCCFISSPARAGRDAFPPDFPVPPVTYGGAGGGASKVEAALLHRYPVIMVPGLLRDHRDWTRHNPGNTPPADGTSVYDRLLDAGFRPVELWMIDFAREGEEMTSLEEATDDLKFFITAVMRYTGADRVQILAHDTGCLLSRLTILKYHLAQWIESEVYIAGPFHGLSPAPDPRQTFRGHPNAWSLSPGSDLLREITFFGESPLFRNPFGDEPLRLPTLTIRGPDDPRFAGLPDSPALTGAINAVLPGLDHDGLRCALAAAGLYLPFLTREARPLSPEQDHDRDGFRGMEYGGPDRDDGDPKVYPGAPEIRGDGLDQDCNGCDLAEGGGRDGEIPLPRRKPPP